MTNPSRQSVLVLSLAFGLPGALVTGCTRPSYATHGKKADVNASYTAGGLDAKIPGSVSVLAVKAAAEAELRSRGYVITESVGTTDRMSIVARSAGENHSDSQVVSARVTRGATAINIDPGWFGDESAARALLDGLLNRLGR